MKSFTEKFTEKELTDVFFDYKEPPYHNLEISSREMLRRLEIELPRAKYLGPQMNDEFTVGQVYDIKFCDYYDFGQVTHGLSARGNNGSSYGFKDVTMWEIISGTQPENFGKTEKT